MRIRFQQFKQALTLRILELGRLALFLALSSTGVVSHAAPTGPAQPASLPVIGHGSIQWSQPAGWNYTPPRIDPEGRTPLNFRLQGPGGHPTLLVTVMWDGIGTNALKPTLERLESELKQAATNDFIGRSLEKFVTVRTVETVSLRARYATFTDAALSGKPLPPGETRNATLGTFRTGELWGRFMLMTNDADGDEFRSSLQVIQSLRATP